MRVLIACEESQEVCKAFRAKGHEAYSCDLKKTSGGNPAWHIQMDALAVINGGILHLQNDKKVEVNRWDLIIAHPPCTYLSKVTTRFHSVKLTPINQINARTLQRISGMDFFMRFVYADCDRIAIENPVGIMSSNYRAPDQIIHPYMFAESTEDKTNYCTKATCLWLKGLPPLKGNNLPAPDNEKLYGKLPSGKNRTWEDTRSRVNHAESELRSKTFPGIARAMAEQWG